MQLTDLYALLKGHNWLGAAMLFIAYATYLLSPASKFPLTIPPIWGRDPKPLVVAVLMTTWGVLFDRQAGESWLHAARDGLLYGLVTMGLFDLVVKFCFANDPPRWLKTLLLLFPRKRLEDLAVLVVPVVPIPRPPPLPRIDLDTDPPPPPAA